jgi:hypothetical protein
MGVIVISKTENQKHASRHRPARRPLMVFDSRPNEPVTLFIKCILALYLSGQLKLFHIYPVNMVNSKKE